MILENIECRKYKITKYLLNKTSGSTYDAWIKMGSPQKMNNEMFNYLKSKEQMEISVMIENIKEKRIMISEILDVDSIVFLELEPLD